MGILQNQTKNWDDLGWNWLVFRSNFSSEEVPLTFGGADRAMKSGDFFDTPKGCIKSLELAGRCTSSTGISVMSHEPSIFNCIIHPNVWNFQSFSLGFLGAANSQSPYSAGPLPMFQGQPDRRITSYSNIIGWSRCEAKDILILTTISNLVGGWTNPSEKYARQIGFIFPKFRGANKTSLKPPPSNPWCVVV